MPFLGVKISAELETLIDEEVKRSEKSKSDIARDALNQYFNVAIPEGTGLIVFDKNELIDLIDSRLAIKPDVKPEVKTEGLTVKPEIKQDVKLVKPEVKPEGSKVKPEIKQDVKPVKPDVKPMVKPEVKPTPLEDPVTTAKRFILTELEGGREPTAAEVAEAVEMDPKRLGTLLGRAGIKARSVHRGGVKARRYTFDLKEKIEEILTAESDKSDRGTADQRR